MRAIILIRRQIPLQHIPAPVPRRPDDQVQIAHSRSFWKLPGPATYCSVKYTFLLGNSVMHRRQRRDIPRIQMKSRPVDILRRRRIAQDIFRIAGHIAVMILDDDLGGDTRRLKSRPKILPDKNILRRILHHTCRIVVRIQWLVLRRNRIEIVIPLGPHRLDIFDKILRIHGIILRKQGPARWIIICPSSRPAATTGVASSLI